MGLLSHSALSLLALIAFAQTTMPVAQAMKECDAEMDKLYTAGNPSDETLFALADRYASKIDYSKVTLAEALTLSEHFISYSKIGYEGIVKSAKSFPVGKDRPGLDAAVLNARIASIAPNGTTDISKERLHAAVDVVIRHPMASECLKSPDGSHMTYAMYIAAAWGALDERQCEAIGKLYQKGSHSENATFLPLIWQSWLKENGANKSVSRLWELYHSTLQAALETEQKASKPNEDTLKSLKRGLEQMESKAGRGQLVGTPAPAITFKWCSDGVAKSLADYKGKVVVIDFWATWCGPCMDSMPKVRELTEHYKGKPVVVLGVTSIQGALYEKGNKTDFKDKPEAEIAAYPEWLKRNDITWNIAVSEQDVYNSDYGVDGIPYMVIIDAEGVVKHIGLHPGMLTLEQKIKLIDPLIKAIK